MTEVNYNEILNAIAKLSPSDFDKLAGSGKTVLAVGHFGDDFVVPELKNGWNLRLLPAGQAPNHRQLIIQPGSSRAKDIWRKGQVVLAMSHGLNQVQAEVWAAARNPRRHELIGHLGKVVQDQKLIDAYLNYTPEGNYGEWSRRWGIKDGLSPINRRFLVEHLKVVLEGEKRAQNPINKKLQEIKEADKNKTVLSEDLLAIITSKPETATNDTKVTQNAEPAAAKDVVAATVETSADSNVSEAQEVLPAESEVEAVEAEAPVVVNVGADVYE